MNLSKTNLSIASLLNLMEHRRPEGIHLNQVMVGERDVDWFPQVNPSSIPTFTVRFAGYVEVDFYMATDASVEMVCVRQAAMNFHELEDNGEVLPTLAIECDTLSELERERLDGFALRYIEEGKMYDAVRGEALLAQYMDKAMFSDVRFREIRHV